MSRADVGGPTLEKRDGKGRGVQKGLSEEARRLTFLPLLLFEHTLSSPLSISSLSILFPRPYSSTQKMLFTTAALSALALPLAVLAAPLESRSDDARFTFYNTETGLGACGNWNPGWKSASLLRALL